MYPAPATSKPAKPATAPSAADHFLGDLSRSLSQLARELKCNRQRILAEFDLRRLLDDNVLELDLVQLTQDRAQPLFKLLLLS